MLQLHGERFHWLAFIHELDLPAPAARYLGLSRLESWHFAVGIPLSGDEATQR